MIGAYFTARARKDRTPASISVRSGFRV
jgi:hypothetical protein